MSEIIKKLTFGKPRQLLRPTIWTFFEDFFGMFSAIVIYFAINMLASAFQNTNAINYKFPKLPDYSP